MITSFLKRLKGTPSEGPKEPEWKKMLNLPPLFEEVPPSREVSLPKKEQVENQSKILQEYYQVKNREETEELRNIVRKEPQRNQKVTLSTMTQEQVIYTPDKEKIIDGIIWSEILGPPRAVKSHSSRRAVNRR
jgi:hypothetical protein